MAATFAADIVSADAAEFSAATAVEKKRVPFQKFVTSACGGSSSQCYIPVTNVRRRQRLEITDVSCRATVASPANPDYFALRYDFDPDETVSTVFLPVKTSTRVGTQDTLVGTTRTRFVGNAGYHLSAGVSGTTDVLFLTCLLSGEKVVLD
jgi:hypothetical protein